MLAAVVLATSFTMVGCSDKDDGGENDGPLSIKLDYTEVKASSVSQFSEAYG